LSDRFRNDGFVVMEGSMNLSSSNVDCDLLPFTPHPAVRGGHAQTLAGALLPGRTYRYRARQHRVLLDDGDQLVLHDDCPPGWRPGDRTAMLIHGLGGSYKSSYMQRIAGRLCERNVRAFRLDLRGAGAGALLARLPYHSGRSDDAAAALQSIARVCPGSPTTLIGFSLGANITLKLLGELGANACGNLNAAIAVSPPLELDTCCRRIHERQNRLYDRRFVDELLRQHRRLLRVRSDAATFCSTPKPRSLYELDDRFTAPVSGFGRAAHYYRQCSSARFVGGIRRPTLILTAADDPLIPIEMFSRLARPAGVTLHVARGGGHLGFIAAAGRDPDRRWMDWRVIDWVVGSPWPSSMANHAAGALPAARGL
jgi:uncharacterized protein